MVREIHPRPMKKLIPVLAFFVFSLSTLASSRPSSYTDLLDYVQPAPDQGETATCLFQASTGAIELLANRKHNIKNPVYNGPFDLSESFTINAPEHTSAYGKEFLEYPVHRFNYGFGVHNSEWPFDAWTATRYVNDAVWFWKDSKDMKKVEVPAVETIRLYSYKLHSTYVLDQEDIELIKEQMWKYKTPILVNYVDDYFWHAVLIVGYDDNLPGECYAPVEEKECAKNKGSFYVRDSFGVPVEIRDTDWFRIQGNAAFVVKEKN